MSIGIVRNLSSFVVGNANGLVDVEGAQPAVEFYSDINYLVNHVFLPHKLPEAADPQPKDAHIAVTIWQQLEEYQKQLGDDDIDESICLKIATNMIIGYEEMEAYDFSEAKIVSEITGMKEDGGKFLLEMAKIGS